MAGNVPVWWFHWQRGSLISGEEVKGQIALKVRNTREAVTWFHYVSGLQPPLTEGKHREKKKKTKIKLTLWVNATNLNITSSTQTKSTHFD